jgi:hypothetical protein
MPTFLGINAYDFVSRVSSVKILIGEFIFFERKSLEHLTGVFGGGRTVRKMDRENRGQREKGTECG